jgi:hypothetical protein
MIRANCRHNHLGSLKLINGVLSTGCECPNYLAVSMVRGSPRFA